MLLSLATAWQVVEKQAALAALQAQVNGATLATASNHGLIVDMQARHAALYFITFHRPATRSQGTSACILSRVITVLAALLCHP